MQVPGFADEEQTDWKLCFLRKKSPRFLDDLANAVEHLRSTSEHHAGTLEDQFIYKARAAIQEESVTASRLAAKWGKSLRYLSKILKDHGQGNFNSDTMVG